MTAIIDPNAVRRHVAILHEVAERAIGLGSAGKFLIASYGEMPPGKKLDAIHAHSAIGDAEGMVRTILALSAVPGRNVYCPLALARFDLPDRVRGSSADHIGAFGICADFDDADAGKAHDGVFGVVAGARHAAEEGNDPRLPDDRGQIVLHAGADAGVAIEHQHARVVQGNFPAKIR